MLKMNIDIKDIIGIADYFSVGNRTESYTSIASQISKYEEYKYVRCIVSNVFIVD